MTHSFVDASVLLEIMLRRQYAGHCERALSVSSKHFSTSALTMHLVYYFGQKAGLTAGVLAEMSAICKVLPLDDIAVTIAQARYAETGKDFEDCLQAAAAEIAGCDEIITLDTRFKADSATRLPVLLVQESGGTKANITP